MSIPQNIKYTTKKEETNVDILRQKIRKNKIDHINFNPIIESNEGKKYYGKLYKPNKRYYESIDVT